MSRFHSLSGSALAAMIRLGKATSEEIVEAHIQRIQEANPVINAVVADRFAAARSEALRADQLTKETPPEKLPPFHGVPCTIKECFAFVGMPNASGIVNRKNVHPERDATAVARLRAAGAIPLGVTNTSEGCMWMESHNYVYGRTNNPYNPKRIVGGSSGGEGAIIAAGGSPFGLGSDIGGSIRMPAFFNGVFGHKASGGLVPGTGQYPYAANEALRYLATGPLARRAEDLWPLLNILAGPDGEDEGCRPLQLGDPAQVEISKLTVTVIEGNGANAVSRDMLEALHKAAGALERLGAKIKAAQPAELRYSRDIWTAMLAEAGSPSFSEVIGGGRPIAAWKELAKWTVRRSPHTLPAILLAVLEQAPKKMPARTRRFFEMGQRLREQLSDLIGADGLVLYPSYPTVAPPHYVPMLSPFKWVYTAIWNVMEFPMTQVPLGLNDEGLPVGVQVGARHGNDHLTIAAALELEKSFGGWTPPPRFA